MSQLIEKQYRCVVFFSTVEKIQCWPLCSTCSNLAMASLLGSWTHWLSGQIANWFACLVQLCFVEADQAALLGVCCCRHLRIVSCSLAGAEFDSIFNARYIYFFCMFSLSCIFIIRDRQWIKIKIAHKLLKSFAQREERDWEIEKEILSLPFTALDNSIKR